MLLKEFSTKVSTKKLNENLAKQFGTKIDVSKFTTEQLEDARNKIIFLSLCKKDIQQKLPNVDWELHRTQYHYSFLVGSSEFQLSY